MPGDSSWKIAIVSPRDSISYVVRSSIEIRSISITAPRA
jgi:hypothetical protein